MHRRLDEDEALIVGVMVRQFDDSEEFVAEARVAAFQIAGRVCECALTPDPTVPEQGQTQCGHGEAGEEEGVAQPGRSVEKAVEEKHEQIRDSQAKNPGKSSLGDLDRPEPLAELFESISETWRQREVAPVRTRFPRFVRDGHDFSELKHSPAISANRQFGPFPAR